MSRATYKNNPSPIAINRIKYDAKQIEESKESLAMEGLYFKFNIDTEIDTNYKMMIIGPADSPYSGGFYLFDAQLPDQYPFHPMTMKTRTQGGGVRKHPNLYSCGKCCFSFLGTWSGPPWTACQNPKTVAASIRSVMTKYPLENEPGWEKVKDDRQKLYARLITFFNIKWGVVNIVENIPSEFVCFQDDIQRVFLNNYQEYSKCINEFESFDGKTEISPTYGFSITYDVLSVKKRLEDLYKTLAPKPTKSLEDHTEKQIKDTKKPTNTIKIRIPRKAPKEPAKNFDLGTVMKNKDGEPYVVTMRVRDNVEQKYWSKCKQ